MISSSAPESTRARILQRAGSAGRGFVPVTGRSVALILIAGAVAAVLVALKGQGQALPALAVGGTLGSRVVARFGPSER
jgi:hypothetical protein